MFRSQPWRFAGRLLAPGGIFQGNGFFGGSFLNGPGMWRVFVAVLGTLVFFKEAESFTPGEM